MTKVFPRVLNFRLIYLPLLGQFDLLKCLTVIFSPCTIFEVSPFLEGWGAVPPTVCGILAPQPGIEPKPLAVEARSLNHWTTRREVSLLLFFFFFIPSLHKSLPISATTTPRSLLPAVMAAALPGHFLWKQTFLETLIQECQVRKYAKRFYLNAGCRWDLKSDRSIHNCLNIFRSGRLKAKS